MKRSTVLKGICLPLSLLSLFLTTGCQGRTITNAYHNYNLPSQTESQQLSESTLHLPDAFSANLAVLPQGFTNQFSYEADANEMLLVNDSTNEILYSKDSMKQTAPASTTKLLTAYIVLTQCNLNDTVVISDNIYLENGAVALFLKKGDRITVDELLHGLLIESANDCAVALANYVSGSVKEFAKLMNQTAKSIGATHSHFKNPHGLDETGHYSCAYDLYLILKKDLEIPHFVEIVSTREYTVTYHDEEGEKIKTPITSTNHYFSELAKVPDQITIIGGKTGTTSGAGHCLVLSAQNAKQEQLIGVVLHAGDKTELYDIMSHLLTQNQN